MLDFLHGIEGHISSFTKVWTALQGTRHRVALMSIYSDGASLDPFSQNNISRHARDRRADCYIVTTRPMSALRFFQQPSNSSLRAKLYKALFAEEVLIFSRPGLGDPIYTNDDLCWAGRISSRSLSVVPRWRMCEISSKAREVSCPVSTLWSLFRDISGHSLSTSQPSSMSLWRLWLIWITPPTAWPPSRLIRLESYDG
jgi:hypothetical protein